MSKYEYKGRSKIITEIPKRNCKKPKHTVDQCCFLLLSAYPLAGIKKLGCPLSNDYYDDEVLNIHLDVIHEVCKNPFISIVGGFDIKRIFKHHRRNEFQIIENTLFEFTNSCEDLRIGLNGIPQRPTVVVDAAFLPSIETYRLLLAEPNDSKIIYSKRASDCVGCNLTKDGLVNFFGYSYPCKTKGAYILSVTDIDRIKKKMLGSTFNKTKFDYEILDELRLIGIEDTSKSLRLDENYDIGD
jgi:hypothetical protein